MNYFLVCALMGAGIGLDVALATWVQGRVLKQRKLIVWWISGVTATHTLFPMLGFFMAYSGVRLFPEIMPVLGAIAFVLITFYLLQQLTSDEADGKIHQASLALLLAISWDALWSGPAKSAQALGWSTPEVMGSFVVVGLVVLGCALGGLWLSGVTGKLNRAWHCGLTAVQHIVIAYFGVLALSRYSLGLEVDFAVVLGFAASLVVLAYTAVSSYRQALWAEG